MTSLTTIGSSAFEYMGYNAASKFTEIRLDGLDKLTSIGSVAFEYVGQNAKTVTTISLNGCSSLVNIPIQVFNCVGEVSTVFDTLDLTDCSSLTYFGTSAMRHVGYASTKRATLDLRSLTSLTQIIDYAFRGCNWIEALVLPSSLTYISNAASGATFDTSTNPIILSPYSWYEKSPRAFSVPPYNGNLFGDARSDFYVNSSTHAMTNLGEIGNKKVALDLDYYDFKP